MATKADWLRRYENGECTEVWAEIANLDNRMRSTEHAEDTRRLAVATMERVRHNIAVLAEQLTAAGYRLARDPIHG